MNRLIGLCLSLFLAGCASVTPAVDPSVPTGPVRIQTRYWVASYVPYGTGDPLCVEVSAGGLWLATCAKRDSQKFEFIKLPGYYMTVFPKYQIRAGQDCVTMPEPPQGFKMGDVKLGEVKVLPCVPGDDAQVFAYHPQGEIIATSPRGYCIGGRDSWMQRGNILYGGACRMNDNWTAQQILDAVKF